MHSTTLLLLPFIPFTIAGICPGFNFGVGSGYKYSGGGNKKTYSVYDSDCHKITGTTTSGSPCNGGPFTCTNGIVTGVTVDGLKYKCRTDPREGNCGDDAISTCVSDFFV
jgi:hypothetical protein